MFQHQSGCGVYAPQRVETWRCSSFHISLFHRIFLYLCILVNHILLRSRGEPSQPTFSSGRWPRLGRNLQTDLILDARCRTPWAGFFNTGWAAKTLLDHRYLDDDARAVATQMFHARGADDADVDYIRLGFPCVMDFPCALFPTTSFL